MREDKKTGLIALPAKPVAEEDYEILWTLSVGTFKNESLTITLEGDNKFRFWMIYIKAQTFEAAVAMREKVCRRLGLRTGIGFCEHQHSPYNSKTIGGRT